MKLTVENGKLICVLAEQEMGKYHLFFVDTETNKRWTDKKRWVAIDKKTAMYNEADEPWRMTQDLKRIFYYAEYFGVTVDDLAIAYFEERVPLNEGYDPTFWDDGETVADRKKKHWTHLNTVGCQEARCRACIPTGDDGECKCACTGKILMGESKPIWNRIKNVYLPFHRAAMPTGDCPYRAE